MKSGVQRRPLTSQPGLKCSLGDAELDSLLRGGIPCGSITEIVGVLLSPHSTPDASDSNLNACLRRSAFWPLTPRDDRTQARRQQERRRHACSC